MENGDGQEKKIGEAGGGGEGREGRVEETYLGHTCEEHEREIRSEGKEEGDEKALDSLPKLRQQQNGPDQQVDGWMDKANTCIIDVVVYCL